MYTECLPMRGSSCIQSGCPCGAVHVGGVVAHAGQFRYTELLPMRGSSGIQSGCPCGAGHVCGVGAHAECGPGEPVVVCEVHGVGACWVSYR